MKWNASIRYNLKSSVLRGIVTLLSTKIPSRTYSSEPRALRARRQQQLIHTCKLIGVDSNENDLKFKLFSNTCAEEQDFMFFSNDVQEFWNKATKAQEKCRSKLH